MKLYCYLLSFLSWLTRYPGPYVSGHDWFEREDGELECRRCTVISHWFVLTNDDHLVCTNCGKVTQEHNS